MKRSHENDSPILNRIVAIVTIFAVCVCCLCACLTTYKMSQLATGTVAAPAAAATAANSGTAAPAANSGTAAPAANSGNDAAAPADNSGDAAAPAAEGETDPAAVLAKYTEVMDKLKTCKTYDKKEFQALPSDEYDLGTIGNIILPIAEGMMTSEDKAEEQHRDDPQGQIPIIDNPKGCLLTDASKLAPGSSIVDNGDGTSTITLITIDEDNPEPAPAGATTAPSYTGAVFNPMSRADIDAKLAEISAVKVNSFNLTYTGCKAVLTFNNDTLEATDLVQYMNVKITANVKALIVTIDGYATLHNTMHVYNIVF